jgi:hypothetical protein
MSKKIIFKNTKNRFIFFGIFNAFITNLILQILLFFVSSVRATFVSQMVNFFLGYYLYGKKVFGLRILKTEFFCKYLILIIFLWNINWISIDFIHSFGISKNLVSLVIVPFLALISYVSQKYIVFKS